MTTDKNNFLVPAGNCPPTQAAAQLRGDKKDVVFTSCSSCFQLTYRQGDFSMSANLLHEKDSRPAASSIPSYRVLLLHQNSIQFAGSHIVQRQSGE